MIDKNEIYLKIGEKIKFIRKKKSLKQEDLSHKIGLKRSSIAQIEAGKQAVSIHALYRIGEVLNTNIFDLLPQDEFDSYSMNRLVEKKPILNILEKKRIEVKNV
jgi:transcriptional regulator with XRE-family HTH domain